jgi:hypothetical protein
VNLLPSIEFAAVSEFKGRRFLTDIILAFLKSRAAARPAALRSGLGRHDSRYLVATNFHGMAPDGYNKAVDN